uniref:Uncharacterized protein n=1 Tax=Zea mays TaxID=4577 RepID=C4J4K3_MAIZE|nr:unknown [Zea mays]
MGGATVPPRSARDYVHHGAACRHGHVPHHGLHPRRQRIHPLRLRRHVHGGRLRRAVPRVQVPARGPRVRRLRGARPPGPDRGHRGVVRDRVLHHGRLRQPPHRASTRDGHQRLLRLHGCRLPRLRHAPLPHGARGGLPRGPHLPLYLHRGLAVQARAVHPHTCADLGVRGDRAIPGVHRAAEQRGRGARGVQLVDAGHSGCVPSVAARVCGASADVPQRHGGADAGWHRFRRHTLPLGANDLPDVLAGRRGVPHHRLLPHQAR